MAWSQGAGSPSPPQPASDKAITSPRNDTTTTFFKTLLQSACPYKDLNTPTIPGNCCAALAMFLRDNEQWLPQRRAALAPVPRVRSPREAIAVMDMAGLAARLAPRDALASGRHQPHGRAETPRARDHQTRGSLLRESAQMGGAALKAQRGARPHSVESGSGGRTRTYDTRIMIATHPVTGSDGPCRFMPEMGSVQGLPTTG